LVARNNFLPSGKVRLAIAFTLVQIFIHKHWPSLNHHQRGETNSWEVSLSIGENGNDTNLKEENFHGRQYQFHCNDSEALLEAGATAETATCRDTSMDFECDQAVRPRLASKHRAVVAPCGLVPRCPASSTLAANPQGARAAKTLAFPFHNPIFGTLQLVPS